MGFNAEDIPDEVADDVQWAQSLVRDVRLSFMPEIQWAQSLVRPNVRLSVMPDIQWAHKVVWNVGLIQSLVRDVRLSIMPDIQWAHKVVWNVGLIPSWVPNVQLATAFLSQFNDWAENTVALEESRALSDVTPDTSLSRSQKRFLFGYFVYSVVLSLCVLAAVRLVESNETDAAALALLTTVTGWSGLSLAKAARDAAFRIFDATYSPDES